jgi:hypothetical protein
LWSRATEKLGTVGDALFLMGHLIGSFLVWRLFPAVLALVRRPRLPSPESERRAGAVNSYCLWFLFWTLVIAFTVVQVDVGRFSAWNISDHTVSNITWIGVILAAIGLYRVVRRVLSPRWGIRLAAGALVVIVGLTPLTMRGVAGMRSEPGQVLDAHLYELLLKVPDYTPPQALVAQNFDTKTGAWVSGVSGRSTPLERADTWRAYRPVEEKRRAEAIHALYQAPTTDTAIEAAIDLGADYVIVGPDDPSVLAEAGTELVRSGPWILVRIP